MRLALLSLLFATSLVCAILPSPQRFVPPTQVFGSDCAIRTFTGIDTLVPELSGSTNSYCTDNRGCQWNWTMTIVPCTASLLAFTALVGTEQIAFSQISPTIALSLRFQCVETANSVSLMLKPSIGGSQIMEWRYAIGTCSSVLAEIGSNQTALPAAFTAHNVLVSLGTQEWGSQSVARLTLVNNPKFSLECGEKRCYGANEYAQNTSNTWTACFDPCRLGKVSFLGYSHVNFQCLFDESHVSFLILSDSNDQFDWDTVSFYLTWRYLPIDCNQLLANVFTGALDSLYLAHDAAFSETFYNFSQTSPSYSLRALLLGANSSVAKTNNGGSSSGSVTTTIIVFAILAAILCIVIAAVAVCCYFRYFRGKDMREIRLAMYERTHEHELPDDDGVGGATTDEHTERMQELQKGAAQVAAERQEEKERNQLRTQMQSDKSWLYTEWNEWKAKYSKVLS